MLKRLWIGGMVLLAFSLHAANSEDPAQETSDPNLFSEMHFVFSETSKEPSLSLSWIGNALALDELLTSPDRTLQRYFSDERENRILHHLQSNEWAKGFKCSVIQQGDVILLSVKCLLDDLGTKNWPQVLSEILAEFRTLTTTDLTLWVQEEQQVNNIIEQLTSENVNRSEVFNQEVLSSEALSSSISSVLEAMLSLPMKISLSASKDVLDIFPELFPEGDLQRIAIALLPPSQFTSKLSETKNPFLPKEPLSFRTNVDIKEAKKIPNSEKNSKNQTLYFIPENAFGTPKTTWRIDVSHPFFLSDDPKKLTLVHLWREILHQQILPASQAASFALSKIQTVPTEVGFQFVFSLWSPVAPENINGIIWHLNNISLDQETLIAAKTSLLKERAKIEQGTAFTLAQDILEDVIAKQAKPSHHEMKTFLDGLSQQQVLDFGQTFSSSAGVVGMYIGTENKKLVLSTWEKIGELFQGNPVRRANGFMPEPGIHTTNITRPETGNAACLAIYFGENYSVFSHVISSFLKSRIELWIKQHIALNKKITYGGASLKTYCGTIFINMYLESELLSSEELHDLLNQILAKGVESLQDSNYFEPQSFDAFKQVIARESKLPPDSVEEWANQLSELAFDRQENWNFWQYVAVNTRQLNWKIANSYIRSVLSRHTARRLLVTVESESTQ